MNPSAIARAVERGRGHPAPVERRALITLICERHERRRRGAHIYLDSLRTAAPFAPQIGGGNSVRGEHCSGSLTGAKSSRDYRIATCNPQLMLIRNIRAAERSKQI